MVGRVGIALIIQQRYLPCATWPGPGQTSEWYNQFMVDLIVIGGGLAGSEAAFQAAQRGLNVWLYEMRPTQQTGAHQTHNLAELVCSNSLGSNLPDRASGLLKNEA